jgi:hypothetical protein
LLYVPVVNSANDPFPGWVDNVYGPIGLFIAAGKGVLRVVYDSKHTTLDLIPVDFVIKTVIAAAWKLGLTKYDQYIHTYTIHFQSCFLKYYIINMKVNFL